MATQFLDNFSAYGNGGQARMLNGLYAENGNATILADPDPTGSGELVLRQGSNNSTAVMCRRVLSAGQTTLGLASRIWLVSLPQDVGRQPCFALFRDVSNVDLMWITCDPSGNIQAWNYNNNNPLLIGQSASPAIVANAWQHVETKVFFANGTGTVEVRVEGAQVLSVTGAVTSWNGNACQNVGPGYRRDIGVQGPFCYVKDLIIWDGTGAFNNNFFGRCFVHDCVPDADDSFNWTPSSGVTGWNLIDGAPPADDVDYVEADATPPPASIFNLSDLPPDAVTVKSVMTMVRARNTDGGIGNLQVGLKSGASTGLGADRPITTAYTYYVDPFDTDPNGGIAWSVAAVNALDLQLNRTA